MEKKMAMGLEEALSLTLRSIHPLAAETVELIDAGDRLAATDIYAMVDSPSIDASLKDGYAVVSSDVNNASDRNPVTLQLRGSVAAGDTVKVGVVHPGQAVRILTGAKLPDGCNAVVAEEFTELSEGAVKVMVDAAPGRNILPKGSDVKRSDIVVKKGSRIGPGMLGLLAAAGHSCIEVVRQPEIGVVATGDEVVAPGQPLPEGKLYASNIVTLSAWCRRFGFVPHLKIVPDDADQIEATLRQCLKEYDGVLTSGGAWTGDRDLVARILDGLGWDKKFHRIRIGPGKAVGFGLFRDKPVFILPGGPPSNLMGFLQIALPGLLKLAGSSEAGLPTVTVQTENEIEGRFSDWTQFIFGTLKVSRNGEHPIFLPIRRGSRLRSMAEAQAVLKIPEGQTTVPGGAIVPAQLLSAY